MNEDHTQNTEDAARQIVAAALAHVPFDGWSNATLAAALRDTGHAAALGAGLFPRGGVDLARHYHRAGDSALPDALLTQDLTVLRYRDKIATAIRLRLRLADKECARKSAALFAMPQFAPEGAALIWGTADAIWTALGDSSRDVNWYSKRATLTAVYASVLLFWLGDTSPDDAESAAFIDRRIENVMQFETFKSNLRQNRFANAVFAGPLKVLERVSAPKRHSDMPGQSQ